MMRYLLGFGLAFVLSLILVPMIKRLAIYIGAVDLPNARKIHLKPLPRIGGVAIVLSFVVTFLLHFSPDRRLIGLLIGLLIVFIVGLVDDLKGLKAWNKLGWQSIAAASVLLGGIGVVLVSNPIDGGVIFLDGLRIPLQIFGFNFTIIPLANLVSIIWIVGMINTVNFLDGMDGLAAGVSAIAATGLAVLALMPAVNDPQVALMAFILVGSLLGFLVYNWHPSSIIMGDSGAYSIGLILAVLSIYAGSKIAVGVLVLGVAIIDSIWAVVRRLLAKKHPFTPDRGHIHHQLLDSGLTQPQVVSHLYIVAASVAIAVVFGGAKLGFLILLLSLVVTVSLVRIRTINSAAK